MLTAVSKVSNFIQDTNKQTNKQTDKQTDKQTNRQRDISVCFFVRLFVVSVRGNASQKFRGGGIKIRDQPINTRNLVSWFSGKSLKYCHQMSHSEAKMDQIWFLMSVRLFVVCSLFVCELIKGRFYFYSNDQVRKGPLPGMVMIPSPLQKNSNGPFAKIGTRQKHSFSMTLTIHTGAFIVATPKK